MTKEDLLERLKGPSPVQISAQDLATLLASAEVLREENTGVAGLLRVVDLDRKLFIQEETPQKLILARPRSNLDEAMAFVDRRLKAYERMWDG